VILKVRRSSSQGKLPCGRALPIFVERKGLDVPPIINLSNAAKTIGSCLRCPVPLCTFYRADEMASDFFKEFPADTSTKVCPTDAILIDAETGVPTLLARNLMICNGVPFLIRRLGDTNMRIDGIFYSGDRRLGVAEIEYSDGAILDAPRDLLDDCAVLHARYGIPLKAIDPMVISLRFPNKRSEYWQVIQDVHQVLGIRIGSITIGALLIAMWINRKLEPSIWQQLYADASAPTIEPALRDLLAFEPGDITAYPGWSRASK